MSVLATLVQWSRHTETTLNWTPPLPAGWPRPAWPRAGPRDCTAEGRYYTADFPGVLGTASGSAGAARCCTSTARSARRSVPAIRGWDVDDEHPVGNGGSARRRANHRSRMHRLQCRNIAKPTRSARPRRRRGRHAAPWREAPRRQFRASASRRSTPTCTTWASALLLADGDLGWQDGQLYTCEGEPHAAPAQRRRCGQGRPRC